jgi:hypothetical protein
LLASLASCSSGETTTITPTSTGSVRQAVTGNLNPDAIQIDGPASGGPGADLYANVGTPLNAGATADWVKDQDPNAGTGCLDASGIASCIEPGVTGAPGGTGHWNGVRIVDGLAGDDQDIFRTGGKENEFATWNVGPGSVGSSKYDIVQAYLANNQSTLFFGMERRGTNGTTAFDFEFNQLAPGALPSCSSDPRVPCRSEDDVLFVFELQGSGRSGSATPYVFTWDGSQFVEGASEGLVSSINDSNSTAGGPWGHADSKGNWVTGDLDRFAFGEAAAPISLLPGIDACGGEAYVQVRTRSSVSDTSDLKDTTKVFEYQFLNLSATATLTPSCENSFGYSAVGRDVDGNVLPSPVCHWEFSNGGSSDSCSGVMPAEPGSYTGTVTLSDPAIPACSASDTSAPVNVYAPLSVDLSLSGSGATCPSIASDDVTYTPSPSGGDGSYSYTWNGASCSGASCTIDPADATYCHEQTLSVTVNDGSGLCAAATSEEETYTKVTTVTASDNP